MKYLNQNKIIILKIIPIDKIHFFIFAHFIQCNTLISPQLIIVQAKSVRNPSIFKNAPKTIELHNKKISPHLFEKYAIEKYPLMQIGKNNKIKTYELNCIFPPTSIKSNRLLFFHYTLLLYQ